MLKSVVIVGRPNVGKSTLFNRIAGRRRALTHNLPGMTRDRIEEIVRIDDDRAYRLTDTGGLEFGDRPQSEFAGEIRVQAELAIGEADLVLFVVDGVAGVTGGDQEIATALRIGARKTIVVVNKIDDHAAVANLHEFHTFGFDPIAGVSAEHGTGVEDLSDLIESYVPAESSIEIADTAIRVAIIGRPNVGKSSLLNRLAGEERTVVSEISGTTRDSVDTLIRRGDDLYRIVDTAGIRRKGKTTDEAEKLAVISARKAIARCEIALVLIDGIDGVTSQDATVAGYAEDEGRAAILVVNKWDAVEASPTLAQEFEGHLRRKLKFLDYAPSMLISAKTGRGVDRMFAQIDRVAADFRVRIRTSRLNEILEAAVRDHAPPAVGGKARRFYYATQLKAQPPTIAIFSNRSEPLHFSYKRYLENRFRQDLGLIGTPIHFIIRARGGMKDVQVPSHAPRRERSPRRRK